MRIVEDKHGNRFLEMDNKEDIEKFKEDLLEVKREMTDAHKSFNEGRPLE
ncbi:hypothetical protein [Metallosphaera hakonensis]|nr:hypothetical protein [Metallosphaera hakonensis]